MRKHISSLSLLASTVAALLLSSGPADAATVKRVDTIRVPGEPLASFDIGIVTDTGIYVLTDRSNKSVDLIDAATGKFLGRVGGFTGFNKAAGSSVSGPDGVIAVGNDQLWAGDGDSTVKIIDLKSRSIVDTIATGGQKRVDEMAYDPRDHLVVVVNNADKPPFVTFISSETHKVLGKIVLDHASDGAEQPAWDPVTGKIYLTVPVIDGVEANGAVAVIDPRTLKLEKMLPVTKCMPAGLAVGPDAHLLIGCSDDAVDSGFPAQSLVMDARTGKIVATIDKTGGSDEVWYDNKSGNYYLAAAKNPGGPVLGVVDARTNRWIANLPSGPRAHSVAADPKSGRVFVPIEARKESADCASGCIAVYAPQGE
ncbi:MAG: putative cytochrome cd1-nitrite reductase-like, C-terminal hem d1 [Gammaproteobacteria bacterium]|nr:putative cytochrome cd1-nitrite reductase-like, C-terminal hem d1 [Gammaproteobacteria bacterium]